MQSTHPDFSEPLDLNQPQLEHRWLVPCPGGFYRRPKPGKIPDLAVVARTPFWLFCAGQMGGSAHQGRSRTAHRNKPRVPGVLFPTTVPAAVWLFCRRPKHTTDDTTTTTTRDTKPGSFAIARPVPRVECVGSGHGGAVVLVLRARSFVWCVTLKGARAFKTQAAAAAWWGCGLVCGTYQETRGRV